MSSLLLSIIDAAVIYSGKPIFENLSFNIHAGRKIALVGRNGAGKTTLMRLITGDKELDEGERWVDNGVTIGYLKQDITPKEGQRVSEYIMEEIDAEFAAAHEYKVDIVTEKLGIDPNARMDRLSGGQLRRAGLARALVEESDILLMDEPTNHLDLEAIEWLESYLQYYPGTLLVISHDKTFLSNVTDTVFWLDRGEVKVSPEGFKRFDEWSEMLLEQEARELKNRKSMVAQEVEWASRGVKARRKRNVRRVEEMRKMRDQLKRDESAYRRATKKVSLNMVESDEQSSKVVAEFYNVKKTFETENGDLPILDKFNLRIKRGDRIGILGKNGSGKTTFLKMLIGQMEPDTGRVKLSKTSEISYFDQKRSDLDPKASIQKTLCPQGGEYIKVGDKERHICGYIKDFMFDPADINKNVGVLSGGEKNRLMLARVLAQPGNFLILDEPTNDLDMDTLDMLEEILSRYQGTLFIVSHDRDFLDQTVSQILAFEGNTKVTRIIGGYSDYLEYRDKTKKPRQSAITPVQKKIAVSPISDKPTTQKKQKLSYKEKYELEELPKKMGDVEKKIDAINKALTDAEFYQRDPDGFHKATVALTEYKSRLSRYEDRWLELEEIKSNIES